MIRNFKPLDLSDKDIQNLYNLNPFWKKDVTKIVKKLNIWLKKFNKNGEEFTIKFPVEIKKYKSLFKKIDNYIHFFNQKYQHIKSNPQILKKFYKLLVDYSHILAWTHFICKISEFYNVLESKNIENKQKMAINIANEFLLEKLKIYKNNMLTNLVDDEFIKLNLDNISLSENQIVKYELNIKQILKYIKTLRKKQKISESTFMNCAIDSVELISFKMSFTYFYSKFCLNIY